MIKKIDLPYPMNALEPYYSRETLKIHYETLYTGYVDNTNKTEEKLKQARRTNNFENIKCLEKDLSFYGSGAILHQLFFENMGPPIPTSPDFQLMEQINKDFGNYDTFKRQFTEAAKAVEASRLVSTSMGAKISEIRNTTMRETSKFNFMGLRTIISIRYVGTFILFTI